MVAVLWLCGPPGVGKSTVAWEVYTRLTGAGYVDIDQLGICFPEPESDPGRYRMKERNLAAVVAHYGTPRVVVSGVVDPAAGVDRRLLPQARLTVVRLRADRAVLRARLTGRGDSGALVRQALQEADELDRSGFADATIDTTGLSILDTVHKVLAL